ncbi:MAG: protoheme IX farnesyltransferase [Planctomycetota bacterium]|nr:MAG: protoheme IX farnesyltransferase [Planctomycetota bacterium]
MGSSAAIEAGAAQAVHAATRAGPLRDAIALTKPGITKLVTITAAVGFALGALEGAWSAWRLVALAGATLAGTALAAAGANALNQVAERKADARMPRTRERPIPAGRLSPAQGLAVALCCSFAGLAVLALFVGPAPATLAAATILLYIAAYTPAKQVTMLSTVIGAVPGALPTLIGFAGAKPEAGVAALASPAAWALFLVLFAWQMPHFLAIAWMHREGYACAGFRVLSVGDESGARTAWVSFIWTGALVAATLLAPLATPAVSGWLALPAAALLGGLFLRTAARFVRSRTRQRARALFLLSILHLPVYLAALTLDGLLTTLVFGAGGGG